MGAGIKNIQTRMKMNIIRPSLVPVGAQVRVGELLGSTSKYARMRSGF